MLSAKCNMEITGPHPPRLPLLPNGHWRMSAGGPALATTRVLRLDEVPTPTRESPSNSRLSAAAGGAADCKKSWKVGGVVQQLERTTVSMPTTTMGSGRDDGEAALEDDLAATRRLTYRQQQQVRCNAGHSGVGGYIRERKGVQAEATPRNAVAEPSPSKQRAHDVVGAALAGNRQEDMVCTPPKQGADRTSCAQRQEHKSPQDDVATCVPLRLSPPNRPSPLPPRRPVRGSEYSKRRITAPGFVSCPTLSASMPAVSLEKSVLRRRGSSCDCRTTASPSIDSAGSATSSTSSTGSEGCSTTTGAGCVASTALVVAVADAAKAAPESSAGSKSCTGYADLAEQICSTRAVWALDKVALPFERSASRPLAGDDASQHLGLWMVWMVHRVALNDPSLKELDFSGCSVPAEDDEPRIVRKLIESLAKNKYLVRLSLCGSNLSGSRFARGLAEALAQKSCSLQVLDIRCNQLTPLDLTTIVQALAKNDYLREFCCGSQQGMFKALAADEFESTSEALDRALQINTTLLKLEFPLYHRHWRDQIGRKLLRNAKLARKTRLASTEH